MDNYTIISKKYRPQKFQDIYEQSAIVVTLKNAIRLNRLGHAYLFCGCRGTGKTTLARLFAKALNCKERDHNQEPCNRCASCLEISSGSSLDVIEIDGASNRGIDDIRSLNETVGYAPSSGQYKIYLIDEVHMLTKEAFNALLKTLEEPPKHVLFFFATTEPHKVLPTIVSRTQRFNLKRISPKKIAAKLKMIAKDLEVDITEKALLLIANRSEGSLRDAESLLDQMICFETPPINEESLSKTLGLVPIEEFFKLDKAAAENNFAFAFELVDSLFRQGLDAHCFFDSLTEHYRQIALCKLGKEEMALCSINKDQLSAYKETAKLYTKEQVLTILDDLISTFDGGGKQPFNQIQLETVLLHIIRSMRQMPIDNLIKQLLDLKEEVSRSQSAPYKKTLKLTAQEQAEDKPTTLHPPENQKIPLTLTHPNSLPKSESQLENKAPAKEEAPPHTPLASTTLLEEKTVSIKEPPAPLPTPVETPSLHSNTQLKKKIKHDRVLRFTSVLLNGDIQTD